MTTITPQSWLSCPKPAVDDIIRWREPVWDKPSKPRGKPDKIGEQAVTARVITMDELVELEVIEIKQLALIDKTKDVPVKIKKGDLIRRKLASIKSGECQRLAQEA